MQVSQPVESVSKQAFQEKLDSLSLELIAKKLMHPEHGQGWTPSQINQAITRYKMFLHLIYLGMDKTKPQSLPSHCKAIVTALVRYFQR